MILKEHCFGARCRLGKEFLAVELPDFRVFSEVGSNVHTPAGFWID